MLSSHGLGSLTVMTNVMRSPVLRDKLRIRPPILKVRHLTSAAAEAESVEVPAKKTKQKTDHRPARVIFSGIQPTGIPHLGNYLGAIRQWKDLQDQKVADKRHKDRLFFSIADLHSLTVKQDPVKLRRQIAESYASLLAVGLHPKWSVMFIQSTMPVHQQMMWILSTVASTGYLSRMTQWKSKTGLADDATLDDTATKDKLKLGLFSYPVLQAADILLYRPTAVPVGEDQAQHVEFARSLARSFNAHYGPEKDGKHLFEPMRLMLSPAKRVMSLIEPTSKMSKSDKNPNARIAITDSADEIRSKINGGRTDSIEGITYDPSARPGVSNLVEILKHVTRNEDPCEDIAADNANISMKAFKEHVANAVVEELAGIGDRYHEIMNPKNPYMATALHVGFNQARSRSGQTWKKVEEIIGLHNIKADLGDITGLQAPTGD